MSTKDMNDQNDSGTVTEIPDDEDYIHHTAEAPALVEGSIIGGRLSVGEDGFDGHGRIEILPITGRRVSLVAATTAEIAGEEVEVSSTPRLTPDQAEQLGMELIESARGARMENNE